MSVDNSGDKESRGQSTSRSGATRTTSGRQSQTGRSTASRSNSGSRSTASKTARTGTTSKSSGGTRTAGSTVTRSTSQTPRKSNTLRPRSTAYNTEPERQENRGRYRGENYGKVNETMKDEIVLIVVLLLCILMVLSYFGICGIVGTGVNAVVFGLFGKLGYALPFMVLLLTLMFAANDGRFVSRRRVVCSVLFLIIVAALVQMFGYGYDPELGLGQYFTNSLLTYEGEQVTGGGFLGGLVVKSLCPLFGTVGAVIIMIAIALMMLVLITGKAFVTYFSKKVKEFGQNRIEEHRIAREERRIYDEIEGDDYEYDTYEDDYDSLPRTKRRMGSIAVASGKQPEFIEEPVEESAEEFQDLPEESVNNRASLSRRTGQNNSVEDVMAPAPKDTAKAANTPLKKIKRDPSKPFNGRLSELFESVDQSQTEQDGPTSAEASTERNLKDIYSSVNIANHSSSNTSSAVHKQGSGLVYGKDGIVDFNKTGESANKFANDTGYSASKKNANFDNAKSLRSGSNDNGVEATKVNIGFDNSIENGEFEYGPKDFEEAEDSTPSKITIIRNLEQTLDSDFKVNIDGIDDDFGVDNDEKFSGHDNRDTLDPNRGIRVLSHVNSGLQSSDLQKDLSQSGTATGNVAQNDSSHIIAGESTTQSISSQNNLSQGHMQEEHKSETSAFDSMFGDEERSPILITPINNTESVNNTEPVNNVSNIVPIGQNVNHESFSDSLSDSYETAANIELNTQEETEDSFDYTHGNDSVTSNNVSGSSNIGNTNNSSNNTNNNGANSSVFSSVNNTIQPENVTSAQAYRDSSGAVRFTDMSAAEVEKATPPEPEYIFPPIEFLKKGTVVKGNEEEKERELYETIDKLQRTFESFGVGVKVTDASVGPTVTRYELLPDQGVKVKTITSLSDDIKLALAAAEIRIEAPIPGKAAVGIEVPNKENVPVFFGDLIDSDEFRNSKSKLSIAIGKDISGKSIVSDIAGMPHALIAGATGSGKSVCINALIMSILYKAKPSEVKMIMIDPKRVELVGYNGIPHLLVPVVTDVKKATGALNWAIAEMDDRYKRFADCGVTNLKSYNALMEEQFKEEGGEGECPEKMPQIVIIVDELNDLMMTANSKEVEGAICRLTQLARACGIHVVLATQRPSVNVITGTIKANIPTRMAFAVSSLVDSRTIIDQAGAEKLLGKGDMLFYPQGYPKPVRLQGAFVSDSEVKKVVDHIKATCRAVKYNDAVSKHIENNSEPKNTAAPDDKSAERSSGRDELFGEAGKFIIEKEKASIGMLQRVYKIGFNRAARIMDQLCDAGVVGPEEGTKPRKILMTVSEFEEFINLPED